MQGVVLDYCMQFWMSTRTGVDQTELKGFSLGEQIEQNWSNKGSKNNVSDLKSVQARPNITVSLFTQGCKSCHISVYRFFPWYLGKWEYSKINFVNLRNGFIHGPKYNINNSCTCLRFRNQVELEASVIMGLLIGYFQASSTWKLPDVVCLPLVVGSKSDDIKLLWRTFFVQGFLHMTKPLNFLFQMNFN